MFGSVYLGGEKERVLRRLAVSIAEPPTQIVALFTVTVGSGFTVTVPEAVLVQPVTPSVTTTV